MVTKPGVLMFFVLALGSACAPKADNPADVAAIKAMEAAYVKAVLAGDASALVSRFYADDAVVLDPNAPILKGKEAILAAWKSSLANYTVSAYEIVAEDVRVMGDLAVARGTCAEKATPKTPGGATLDDQDKWVHLFRRQPDGTWRSFIDIWNTDRPVGQTLAPFGDDEQALLQIERDWTSAWQKSDAVALDKILAPEFAENFNGQVTPKARMVAEIKAGAYKVASAELRDMRALVVGDRAVVFGNTVVQQTYKAKDTSGTYHWTDTYEKREGRWWPVSAYVTTTR